MRLKLQWLTCFILTFIVGGAQSTGTSQQPADEFISGYRISVSKQPDNSYGYAIFYGNTRLVQQQVNPFSAGKAGFAKKEDAQKLARWHTAQLLLRHEQKPQARTDFPAAVGRQLKLETN